MRKDYADSGDGNAGPLAGGEEFMTKEPCYNGCGYRDHCGEDAGLGDSEALDAAHPEGEGKARAERGQTYQRVPHIR